MPGAPSGATPTPPACPRPETRGGGGARPTILVPLDRGRWMERVEPSTIGGYAAAPAPQPLPKPSNPVDAALVRMIGALPALKLLEAYGGLTLDVPRAVDRGTKLPEIVGLEAAKILVEQYGGGRMQVPLARAWRACVYRQRDGLSISEIARRLSATDRTVKRWLGEGGMTCPPAR